MRFPAFSTRISIAQSNCAWLALFFAVILLSSSQFASAQTAHPDIPFPRDAHVFDIGSKVKINGLPMRIQGFVSISKPAQVADWFRQRLGKPLVENQIARTLVLGQLQGDHYLTVQLEATGTGTRGLASMVHLKAAHENLNDTQEDKDQWLSRLPSGSNLVSLMYSQDGGRISKHILITNNYSDEVNRAHIKRLLDADGMELERETLSDAKSARRPPVSVTNGSTLYFKGKKKEAVVAIFRYEGSRTAIILEISHHLEQLK